MISFGQDGSEGIQFGAGARSQLLLTETAVKLIDQAAHELGISRSEAVERAARGGKFREAVQAYGEMQVEKE